MDKELKRAILSEMNLSKYDLERYVNGDEVFIYEKEDFLKFNEEYVPDQEEGELDPLFSLINSGKDGSSNGFNVVNHDGETYILEFML